MERGALTLSRRAGERIQIGTDVEVVVREIKGRVAKLVVIAPRSTRILRVELDKKAA
jgi:carbon storage regulator